MWCCVDVLICVFLSLLLWSINKSVAVVNQYMKQNLFLFLFHAYLFLYKQNIYSYIHIFIYSYINFYFVPLVLVFFVAT